MRHLKTFATTATGILLLSGTALAGMKLQFQELPAAVQETVARETRGGQILEIEQEKEKGAVEYEIEYRTGDKEFELDVAADGRVLRHEPD